MRARLCEAIPSIILAALLLLLSNAGEFCSFVLHERCGPNDQPVVSHYAAKSITSEISEPK
jgi:hypothetical protein